MIKGVFSVGKDLSSVPKTSGKEGGREGREERRRDRRESSVDETFAMYA